MLEPSGTLLEERVRRLDEDAGAVAGIGFAAAGAAVLQVMQDLDGLLNDVVRLAALDVDDEADAAGVVLELRIVKPLLGRWTEPPRLLTIICHVVFTTHSTGEVLSPTDSN